MKPVLKLRISERRKIEVKEKIMKDVNKLTGKALEKWEGISKEFQEKILKNVFCVQCHGVTEIVDYTGRVEKGDLILTGKCKKCGHGVARLIENE
jgi:hypothetical protein